MKISTKAISYEKFAAIELDAHELPKKQPLWVRTLLRWLATILLIPSEVRYKKIDMEKLPADQPCLVLMNHSSFIDMEIIAKSFYDRPYSIVCTMDSYVGKRWVMKLLGCISTRKFVTDLYLVKDMVHAVNKLKSTVIMFPEASYSFDGTATALPDSIGKCIKLMKVPVVMVRTYGAFLRDPLYNGLKVRKVKVDVEMEYLLSAEDVKTKSADELQALLEKQFSFDQFRWQQENRIRIAEKFRADGLNRVLYKCPHCLTEGKTLGKGIHWNCQHCGKQYELTEYGYMQATDGETKISHVPDWYRWERECVRKELEDRTYRLDVPVDIYALKNADRVYQIGSGRLLHTREGFHLTGCDGKLEYQQGPMANYSLYSDFYWYELGDVICIGDSRCQYYCFPQGTGDVVAKARLAAEELYKMTKAALEINNPVREQA